MVAANISELPNLVWEWYLATLVDPSPQSWVIRAATTFRLFAWMVILPMMVITSLDVASYVIVRTLGIEPVHAVASSKVEQPAVPAFKAVDSDLHEPPSNDHDPATRVNRPHHLEIPPSAFNRPRFTTPSEGNYALAGVGLFSPPISRASSPPIHRNSRANAHGFLQMTSSESGESIGPGMDSTIELTDADGGEGWNEIRRRRKNSGEAVKA